MGEENFPAVAALFAGSSPTAIVKDSPAGTLNLFNGVRSLHRVLDSVIPFLVVHMCSLDFPLSLAV